MSLNLSTFVSDLWPPAAAQFRRSQVGTGVAGHAQVDFFSFSISPTKRQRSCGGSVQSQQEAEKGDLSVHNLALLLQPSSSLPEGNSGGKLKKLMCTTKCLPLHP